MVPARSIERIAWGRSLSWGLLSGSILASLPVPSSAAPLGPSYDHSQVSITQSNGQTVVDQSTNRAIINWQSFDLAGNESIQFSQPGPQAATLNRVTAGSESVIAGRISAPGQIV